MLKPPNNIPKTLMFAYVPEVLTSIDLKRLIRLKCPDAIVNSVAIHAPRHRTGYLQAKVECTNAEQVIQALNGHEFLSRKLIVDYSRDAEIRAQEDTITQNLAKGRTVSMESFGSHAKKRLMHKARLIREENKRKARGEEVPDFLKNALENARSKKDKI